MGGGRAMSLGTLVTSAAWTAAQPQPRLCILIYHRVLPKADPMRPDDPDVGAFAQQIELLKKHCHVLPLGEAIERLYDGTLPRGAAAITFDDGYADNYTHALPILRHHGAHATFFIATGFLNGGAMFNDRLIEALRNTSKTTADLPELGLERLELDSMDQRCWAARRIIRAIKHQPGKNRDELLDLTIERLGRPKLGESPMMSDRQLLRLCHAGMAIGAHTVTHPILQNLDDESARWELNESRTYLERLLDKPVTLFAYPNGKPKQDYSAREVRLLRECGFRAAVCSQPGGADAKRDCFQLPRYTPHGRGPARFMIQLIRCSREEAVAA